MRNGIAGWRVAGLALGVAMGCESGGSAGSGPAPAAGGAGAHPGAADKVARFDARHEFVVKVPDGAQRVRIWLTRPQPDVVMAGIENERIDAPVGAAEATDDHGNRYLYFELTKPAPGPFTVVHTFRSVGREHRVSVDPAKTRGHTAAEREALRADLQANVHVPIDDRFRQLSSQIVGGERNPTRASRRIYDWVLENIDYWVKDPANKKASPVGSADYCYSSKTGNCTDFHSLYLALSRAAGIPTRITYGSMFKTPLDGKDADQSYHCWILYHAPEVGWIPLDVALADIYHDDFGLNEVNRPKVELTTADGYERPDPARVDYYFGNIEERRVVWSTGRDLRLQHQEAAEPVNCMAKAYVEIDGKPSADYTRKLTYTQAK